MRSKRDLGILLTLTLLASMATITLPPTYSQSPVIFRVEPFVTVGVPAGGLVTVDIYIDAPEGSAIVGWTIDITVDPDVLEPGFWFFPPGIDVWVKSSASGYFLYDWATANDNTTEFTAGARNVTAGTITRTIEGITGWMGLEPGTGASGTGKLATFYFTSKNETAYSPIRITTAYYYTSWNNPQPDKKEPGVLNGHYNEPETLDVAVTSVSALPNATVGETVLIDVDVENLGADTSFLLNVAYDTTLIGTKAVTLNFSDSTTESFSWDTAGVVPDTHTITAEAILENDVNLANNVATTTIKIMLYRVDLLQRSAWPENHHHVVAKHTWDIEFFAIIKNVGTEATSGKVVFTIEDSGGFYVDSVVTDPQPLEPGEIYKGISTVWTAEPYGGDKYFVTANAYYQDAYDDWQKSPDKPKTFSFTVIPPPP